MMIQAVADAMNFKIYVIESSQNFVGVRLSHIEQATTPQIARPIITWDTLRRCIMFQH